MIGLPSTIAAIDSKSSGAAKSEETLSEKRIIHFFINSSFGSSSGNRSRINENRLLLFNFILPSRDESFPLFIGSENLRKFRNFGERTNAARCRFRKNDDAFQIFSAGFWRRNFPDGKRFQIDSRTIEREKFRCFKSFYIADEPIFCRRFCNRFPRRWTMTS